MVIVTAIVVILCYDVVIVTVILCIRQSLWVIVTVFVTEVIVMVTQPLVT